MRTLYLLLCISLLQFTACTSLDRKSRLNKRVEYGARLIDLGLFDDAEGYYLKLLNKEEETDVRVRIYNNLAVISELKGEYSKARDYYKKALELTADSTVFENYKKFTGGI